MSWAGPKGHQGTPGNLPPITCYMIAVGDTHQEMASLTAPRVEETTGLVVHLITDAPDPWLTKLDLLDVASTDLVMLVDADIVFHSWNWTALQFDCFNAVSANWWPEWDSTKALKKLMPYPGRPLFNTGLWIAPKTLAPVFKYAKELAQGELKDSPVKFWDETPLNLALQRTDSPTHNLPRGFNHQHSHLTTLGPKPTRGLHAVHFEGHHNKLARVKRYCEKYPLPE